MRLVVIATDNIVIIESKKESMESKSPPTTNTSESITKILIPTFTPVLALINCAIKSVPPVLVRYLSMKPIPMPTIEPPTKALGTESKTTNVLKGLSKSIKKKK